ncbi:MAG: tetratricopeptide repeat protein [Dokdonella sp.]
MYPKLIFGCSCALAEAAMAGDASLDVVVADLGHRWATTHYTAPETAKDSGYLALVTSAQQVAESYPRRAEPLIWEAIALASAAKVEGGLAALGKAKQAREVLLAAEAIDPTAMQGAVYSTLGSLYAKVPGWPIGFGDTKKAKAYLEKALAINPDGIDANYFYADYLNDQGDYSASAKHLDLALLAPARAGREDADVGRRREALMLLTALKEKHGAELARR